MIWKPMRAPMWAAFRTISHAYLALSGREYRYAFVLGHVRSGSSLLSHILASHPDIAGAGETHLSYQTPTDLQCLVLKTCELLHRPILRHTYIIDQINHPYVSDSIFHLDQPCKYIILIRKPEATLKSMISLGEWGEEQSLELYVNRLNDLLHYGSLLRRRAFLVEYDDLVDRADHTLAALTSFLGLNPPLAPNYTTHRMTGRVKGNGDPSNNIKLGRIVRTSAHDVALLNSTMSSANRAFHECRKQLRVLTANCHNG